MACMRAWVNVGHKILCKVHRKKKANFRLVLSKWDVCWLVRVLRSVDFIGGKQRLVSMHNFAYCTQKKSEKHINTHFWRFERPTFYLSISLALSKCELWNVVYVVNEWNSSFEIYGETISNQRKRQQKKSEHIHKQTNKRSHFIHVCMKWIELNWNEMKRKSNDLWQIATKSLKSITNAIHNWMMTFSCHLKIELKMSNSIC